LIFHRIPFHFIIIKKNTTRIKKVAILTPMGIKITIAQDQEIIPKNFNIDNIKIPINAPVKFMLALTFFFMICIPFITNIIPLGANVNPLYELFLPKL